MKQIWRNESVKLTEVIFVRNYFDVNFPPP